MAAVIQGIDEAAAETADADAGGFTTLARTLDRNARQTLQRRCDVRIREFADIFSRDRVHDTRRIALDVEVALQ